MNMISDTIKYIGVDDLDIDLFESQYVVPEGMSYNSYLIDDEKVESEPDGGAERTTAGLSGGSPYGARPLGTDCLDVGDVSRCTTGVQCAGREDAGQLL